MKSGEPSGLRGGATEAGMTVVVASFEGFGFEVEVEPL